jgi:glycosyltransferase involved in cell wall biosynthesis
MMKRVLIVSNNSLSFSYNNGRTLNSIFSDFEEGSISQVYFNDEVPESKVAKNFYKVTGREQFFSTFKRERYSAGKTMHCCSEFKSAKKLDSITTKITKFVNSHFEYSKLIFRDSLYWFGLAKNKRLWKWIEEQNPDFLFFVVGNSRFSIKFATKISHVLNIPLLVYVTDDYVIFNKPNSILGNIYHRFLQQSYGQLLRSTKGAFYICSEMSRQFHGVYGVDGECLINCNLVDAALEAKPTNDGKVRVVYAGGLHLGRVESLIEFSHQMKKRCLAAGYEFILEVYTNDTPGDLNSMESRKFGIFYKGSLPWSKLQSKLVDADFLLHVESFEPKIKKKTRLSLSTKIPEYMSSGTCVLAFGPKELASIKLFLDEPVGIALIPDDDECWRDLDRALTDKLYKEEISSHARNYAVNNFSPEVIRSRLIKKLSEV